MKALRSFLTFIASATILFFGANHLTLAHNQYYEQGRHVQATPPRWQLHEYIYYPERQMYFSPRSRLWYWNEGVEWRSGYRIPSAFEVNLRMAGIPIRLRSANPYFEHVYVENNYGRPWRWAHRPNHEQYDHRYDNEHRGHFRHHRW